MKLCPLIVLLCTGVLAVPFANDKEYNKGLHRSIRSPTFKKKPLAFLLGGLGGGGAPSGGHGGGNYVTNINNYGPHQQSYHPHGTVDHGHGGGGFAGSAAAAGGYGNSQAQSQSASFALGPYTASFSQSQAQGGTGKGGFDYSDY